MLSAYIDKTIKESQLAHAISIITRNNGMVVEDKDKADLIVKKIVTISDNASKSKIYSLNCLFMMEKELINPFTYKGQSKVLINLFLKNRSFSFYQCSALNVKNCSILIQMMDGVINNENPDYYLTELNSKTIYPNSVLISWIYALRVSPIFIFPQQFFILTK